MHLLNSNVGLKILIFAIHNFVGVIFYFSKNYNSVNLHFCILILVLFHGFHLSSAAASCGPYSTLLVANVSFTILLCE